MKYTLPLSLAILTSAAGYADSNWKMHPTYDGEATHVVETPDYVYFTSRAIPKNNNLIEERHSLFRYDKKGDELQTLSTDNLLSFNTVHDVSYNREKRYLVVVYTNYDVDLIHDDGRVDHIPAYSEASLSDDKTVNGISWDATGNRIYLATAFGYVALNDEKKEVADSRNYATPLMSVARLGSHIIAIEGNRLIAAPEKSPRFSLSDYETIKDFGSVMTLYPLGEDCCIAMTRANGSGGLYILREKDGKIEVGEPLKDGFFNRDYNRDGLAIASGALLYQYKPDGTYERIARADEDKLKSAGSWSLSEVWHSAERKGLKSSVRKDGEWTVTRAEMLPNSPAPHLSSCIDYHPEYGMMVANNTELWKFFGYLPRTPFLLSALKDGIWSNLSGAYTRPDLPSVVVNPQGFTVDPQNPDYIYVSSMKEGFARVNLKNPEDVVQFGNPTNAIAQRPWFVRLVDDQVSTNNLSCCFSRPMFDNAGNLWSVFANYDLNDRIEIFCWEASDLRATTSASDVRPPKAIFVDGPTPNHEGVIIPLRKKEYGNIIVYYASAYNPNLTFIDTNGTPTDSGDDKVVMVKSYIDQDGNNVDVHNINTIYEDQSTGELWVGHDAGVFRINPRKVFDGDRRISRVKVSRNDGTNLADYLLNEVPVMHIIADSSGNKWFATGGAGIVGTGSDGRTILEELTSEDTPLPDDVVYQLGYNPETRSIMASTLGGIAEYYLKGETSSKDGNELKVYPNPVRPEYSGYITIEGVPENALVKIVDSAGNIVKELGNASGSEVLWDGTNHQFKRVSSGVYHILCSGEDGSGSFARRGKVLIVN